MVNLSIDDRRALADSYGYFHGETTPGHEFVAVPLDNVAQHPCVVAYLATEEGKAAGRAIPRGEDVGIVAIPLEAFC